MQFQRTRTTYRMLVHFNQYYFLFMFSFHLEVENDLIYNYYIVENLDVTIGVSPMVAQLVPPLHMERSPNPAFFVY